MASPRIFTPTFVTAAAGNFLFFTGLAGFFLLPLHLKALGATEGQLGVVMGCYTGSAIVLQPIVGLWVDRGPRRPLLLGGAALTGVAAFLFAVSPDRLVVFAALRVLQGLAYSVYFVAMFALVAEIVPADRRGQAFGFFGISGLASNALGPTLGELVVAAFGFHGFFVAAGVLAFGAAAVSARVREPAPGRSRPVGGGEGLAGIVVGLRAAPPLPMLLAVAFGLGLGVVFTFVPTFAATLGVTRVGPFALAYSAAALSVRALGGRLADTLGRRAVIWPALAIQAAGAALLAATAGLAGRGLLPALPLLSVAGLLAGVAHGFLYPALTALVMDVAPEERRGRVVGVFSAFVLSGHAGGAMGFGLLAHALGYGPMFSLLALVLAGAVVLAFRLDR